MEWLREWVWKCLLLRRLLTFLFGWRFSLYRYHVVAKKFDVVLEGVINITKVEARIPNYFRNKLLCNNSERLRKIRLRTFFFRMSSFNFCCNVYPTDRNLIFGIMSRNFLENPFIYLHCEEMFVDQNSSRYSLWISLSCFSRRKKFALKRIICFSMLPIFSVNPTSSNVLFLYLLELLENVWLSDVLMGYINGT